MAIETINGTLQLTRLTNESAEYVARREELRLAEIELMRQHERVAAMRRHLPAGAIVEDYAFQEGPSNLDAGDAPIQTIRLSDTLRHVYSAHPWMAGDVKERGIDLLTPSTMFSISHRKGRDDWYAKLVYSERSALVITRLTLKREVL
jgi:hypothetical protein